MWMIMQKELKELLRDRKTLFFMIAMPLILFPVLIGIVGFFTSKALEDAQTETLKYTVVGAENSPALVRELKQQELFQFVEQDSSTNFEQLIKQEKLDFVLTIPANFDQPALEGGQAKITLMLNDAGLNMVQKRVGDILDRHREDKRRQAFTSLGLDESAQQALIEPIVIDKQDVADKRESWGEKVGGLVPYLIFILCLQGAMYPATDLGAGEKERGTLETLLISPIPRHHLVLGKFITIALAGVVSALITVASMATWGIVLGQGMAIAMVAEFMAAIHAIDFVLMFLMLIPIVAIFASMLLSISIYARSFKEAQSYMGGIMFAVIVPIVLATLPGVSLEDGWAWVPITNVALAIKELIKGTMDYYALFAIFGSTSVIAGGLIAFCVYWFNQEKVLFR
ncbi:ABC transporter permease protein NatB [Saliniradius amylolyticus]|uniref:ABC transporter permease protein NatB n=1 Tax=Saliniradius amylolyticus TaxID=2183582 RepID=A0A2S2E3F5_9ALTE|nr:ABC transporter permease [Saliniradius amylolyticus]AWL11537.1 ABC transporter permease protein NatB [Saliniradius amylolyticus]